MITTINEQDAEQLGWHKFNWNGGIIREYWKSLNESNGSDFSYRIGVRFGEWKDRDFMVWIFTGSSMIAVPRIRTWMQLDILFNLLLRDLKEYV